MDRLLASSVQLAPPHITKLDALMQRNAPVIQKITTWAWEKVAWSAQQGSYALETPQLCLLSLSMANPTGLLKWNLVQGKTGHGGTLSIVQLDTILKVLFHRLASYNVNHVLLDLNVYSLHAMGLAPNASQVSIKQPQYLIPQKCQVLLLTTCQRLFILIGLKNHVFHAPSTHIETAKGEQRLDPAQRVQSDRTHEESTVQLQFQNVHAIHFITGGASQQYPS
jgi:hypothetical protein